ncbi:sulfotransferase family protein [Mycobacterium heidelbergense]|uniref:sulfotransferase family protein n=1 Tax=Mycobacterium heidelbergense TaxID=53376 RepID=UPI003CECA539
MNSVEEALATARSETGLDDFGVDSFREGLEVLLESVGTEADLNPLGELIVRNLIITGLKNRLRIEDWYRRHPEIEDEVIERPLIGLGLPRTGSTALSFLLAEDPHARSLRRWEAGEPCPPPSTVVGPDPRIAAAAAQQETLDTAAPRLAALVPTTPTGPEECQDLMALDFKSQYFQAFAHIPTYSRWLLDADLTPTYAYERRTLKLLQWGQPRRPWRLKCPTHLLFLPHLDRAFPDARYVWTHRDPTEVILSVADLYAEFRQMTSNTVDRNYLGQLNVEHWSVGMQRALAFRDAGNDDRFFDLDFTAVQRDPIGEVKRLYAWLGEPVSAEFEAGMRAWWQAEAASRSPNTHPEAAAFGVNLAAVRPLFADYMQRMAAWTAATRGEVAQS